MGQSHQSSLWFWLGLSLLAHLGLALLTFLVLWVLANIIGIDLFPPLKVQSRDIEFVLVENSPAEKPRDPNTRNRAERASRSGGKKIANQHQAVPQKAAGNPSPRPNPRPQSQPQPQPRQAQPQPRQAPRQAVQRPSTQPTQQQPPTPQPQAPKPTPPAPRAPRPTQVASSRPSLPSNPLAPIKLPGSGTPTAPRNPGASGGGPVTRVPGTSGGSSGGGASGTPGPSMIAGGPSAASRGGGGGAGGSGSHTQSGSPGGGGGRSGIDALPEPDFGPYIAELQRRIRKNWNPPTADRSKRVIALFTIGKDGRLMNYRIKQSSGTQVADQAALAAIMASAPFRPLPVNYRENSIDVEFIFDYEIYGQGGSIHRR